MLGLRQALRLSFKVVDELRLNALSSYHQQCLQRLYKYTISRNEISRQFSLEAKTAIDECKSDNDDVIKQPIGKLEGRLMIKFTCKKCTTRNSKTMSKLAYEKGVVLIRCDGCKNNHLIADNLGWFGNNPHKRNIEKLMSLNGESVKRVSPYNNELFEVVKKEELIGEGNNKDQN